jgi:phage terminase small subunit
MAKEQNTENASQLDTALAGPEFTDKERLFVAYYLLSRNQRIAADRAGYTPENARQQGWEMYHRPHINAVIKKFLSLHVISAEETLANMSHFASANIAEMIKVTPGGDFTLDLHSDPAEAYNQLSVVKKIKHGMYGVELELHDPLKANEIMMKHHGLLKETVIVSPDSYDDPFTAMAKANEAAKAKKNLQRIISRKKKKAGSKKK